MRARSDPRRVRAAVPYVEPAPAGRPALAASFEGRRGRGPMDGFVRTRRSTARCSAPTIGDPASCAELPRPAGPAGRHELHDRAGDPQLLDLRRELRASGPHVRTGRLVDAAGPLVPRLGVGGALHGSSGRDELHVGTWRARPGGKASERAHRDVPIWAWTDITYLLHEQGVSWAYYIGDDTCIFDPCPGRTRGATPSRTRTRSRWFTTVRQDRPDRATSAATTTYYDGGSRRHASSGVLDDAVRGRRRAPGWRRPGVEGDSATSRASSTP